MSIKYNSGSVHALHLHEMRAERSWWENFSQAFTVFSAITGFAFLLSYLPHGNSSQIAMIVAKFGIFVYGISTAFVAVLAIARAAQIYFSADLGVPLWRFQSQTPIMLLQSMNKNGEKEVPWIDSNRIAAEENARIRSNTTFH
jgi:hypothetical protein